MQTQSVRQLDTARSYGLSAIDCGGLGRTDVEYRPRDAGIFRSTPSSSTGVSSLDEDARSLRLVATIAPVVAGSKVQRKSVDGVVAHYDDVTVTCDLRLGGKTVLIQLPRPLFPDEIRYGLPITVQIVDDFGVRKPVIRVRQIDSKAAVAIAQEFDAILEKL